MTETILDTQLDSGMATTSVSVQTRRLFSRHPVLRHVLMLAVWALIWTAAIAAPILIYAGAIQLTGNIDTVERGKLYRSATLSASDLRAVIRAAHIRTVINLRGASPNQSWYQNELKVTEAETVRQIDLPMSAIHEPNPELLAKLVDVLKTAETPMLIHCSSGSDRTGLAAALYEMLVMKKPAKVAEQQLSFYWGHFPWLWSPTIAMDRTFAKVAASQPPQ
jgi:protein tyrosine/serine phosphatase